jgi:hypothetical protein
MIAANPGARFLRPFTVAAVVLVCAGSAPTTHAQSRGTDPSLVATAEGLFQFHSGPWFDLHHMLYAQARTRLGIDSARPAVARSVRDTVGLGLRSDADRAAWELAVRYYEQNLARRDATFDSLMIDIDGRVAAAERASGLRDAGLDATLTEVLERVAPIHRALWWPAHDSANRAWVATAMPILREHGRAIATRVASVFRTDWASTPIRVDLAAYSKGGGAYTTRYPSHITMPSLDENYWGTRAIEMLFHEAMHTLDDSVDAAVRRAAVAQQKGAPDVGHVLIFYTAGELTRQRVAGHVPYAEATGLWRRNRTWGALLPHVQTAWQPYLDRRASFEKAISELIALAPGAR